MAKSSKNKIAILIGIGVAVALISVLAISSNVESINVSDEGFHILTNQPYAPQIIENCENEMYCAVNAMQSIANEENEEKVLDTFAKLITMYDQNYPCHENAHHLGMWLYGYIEDIDKSLQMAEQLCGGAIYHGVIQNYIMSQKFEGTQIEDIDIQSICSTKHENPYSIDRWQCLHGVGHGLTMLYDYDVLSAVKRCEEFKPGLEQLSCSKGVFMQNVINYFETQRGDFKKDDLYYPCNSVDEKYSPACYHYTVTYFALKNDRKLHKTFDDCDNIVPPEMVKYCYYGFGRQLSSNTESIDDALRLCQAGKNSDYHTKCLTGMVMTLVNGNQNPEIGFSFCRAIPEEYKHDCYDGLGKWVRMLHGTDELRAQECGKSENFAYRQVCMDADLESIDLL